MRESDSEMTEQEVRWDVAVQLDGGTFPCTPALSVERSLWKNGLGNAEWLEPIWNLDRSPIVDLEGFHQSYHANALATKLRIVAEQPPTGFDIPRRTKAPVLYHNDSEKQRKGFGTSSGRFEGTKWPKGIVTTRRTEYAEKIVMGVLPSERVVLTHRKSRAHFQKIQEHTLDILSSKASEVSRLHFMTAKQRQEQLVLLNEMMAHTPRCVRDALGSSLSLTEQPTPDTSPRRNRQASSEGRLEFLPDIRSEHARMIDDDSNFSSSLEAGCSTSAEWRTPSQNAWLKRRRNLLTITNPLHSSSHAADMSDLETSLNLTSQCLGSVHRNAARRQTGLGEGLAIGMMMRAHQKLSFAPWFLESAQALKLMGIGSVHSKSGVSESSKPRCNPIRQGLIALKELHSNSLPAWITVRTNSMQVIPKAPNKWCSQGHLQAGKLQSLQERTESRSSWLIEGSFYAVSREVSSAMVDAVNVEDAAVPAQLGSQVFSRTPRHLLSEANSRAAIFCCLQDNKGSTPDSLLLDSALAKPIDVKSGMGEDIAATAEQWRCGRKAVGLGVHLAPAQSVERVPEGKEIPLQNVAKQMTIRIHGAGSIQKDVTYEVQVRCSGHPTQTSSMIAMGKILEFCACIVPEVDTRVRIREPGSAWCDWSGIVTSALRPEGDQRRVYDFWLPLEKQAKEGEQLKEEELKILKSPPTEQANNDLKKTQQSLESIIKDVRRSRRLSDIAGLHYSTDQIKRDRLRSEKEVDDAGVHKNDVQDLKEGLQRLKQAIRIAKARKFDIYTVMYADESKLEAYMKKDDNTTAVARHVERNRRAAV